MHYLNRSLCIHSASYDSIAIVISCNTRCKLSSLITCVIKVTLNTDEEGDKSSKQGRLLRNETPISHSQTNNCYTARIEKLVGSLQQFGAVERHKLCFNQRKYIRTWWAADYQQLQNERLVKEWTNNGLSPTHSYIICIFIYNFLAVPLSQTWCIPLQRSGSYTTTIPPSEIASHKLAKCNRHSNDQHNISLSNAKSV